MISLYTLARQTSNPFAASFRNISHWYPSKLARDKIQFLIGTVNIILTVFTRLPVDRLKSWQLITGSGFHFHILISWKLHLLWSFIFNLYELIAITLNFNCLSCSFLSMSTSAMKRGFLFYTPVIFRYDLRLFSSILDSQNYWLTSSRLSPRLFLNTFVVPKR